jgi:lipopolysaccharide transport system permease protein
MPDIEYEIKAESRFSLNLGELWHFRELIYFFTWRDVKIKYKQTVLGVAWAVLQPLLMMVVFTFIFSRALGVSVSQDKTQYLPYPLFVFNGLMIWTIFSSGITNAGNSMVTNANIIKKIYFPRLIIPMSTILSSLVDFLMSLLIYIVLMFFFKQQHALPTFFLFLIPSVVLTLITTLGLGSMLAALNIKYRDFRYIVPFFVQFLLFLTPVIYPVTIIKNQTVQFLLQLNPLAGAINLSRSALTGISPDWNMIAANTAIALVILVVGIYYFRKTEDYFADLA